MPLPVRYAEVNGRNALERHLAAILALDVVGYSAQMERDESGTFERLTKLRRNFVEPEIARRNGRIFKLMGDGLLAEFASVMDAVECAVSLQGGIAGHNRPLAESERTHIRIGINLGEVIVDGDDRYGDGVNVAARLEQICSPGGILVSGKVAKEVANKGRFRIEPLGERRLKNIAEPVPTFRIAIDAGEGIGAPTVIVRPGLWPSSRRLLLAAGALLFLATLGFLALRERPAVMPATERRSIAVLPFDNLSDDPAQGYLADGIAEDLTTDLSQISELFVVSRNSAFAYRDKALDMRQIGRELGVNLLVEGSVRRTGDTVRFNVQLIDATTGGHIWAERYEGAPSEILALQNRMTAEVVEMLAPEVSPAEQGALIQRDTENVEAYDAFLRGWELYVRGTPQDQRNAIPFFEEALVLDPGYGRAEAALAMIYFRAFDQRWANLLGLSRTDAFRKAREHLRNAQARPSSLSYLVAGNVSRERGWYDDAINEFRVAIALDPGDAASHAELANALIWDGNPDEALLEIEQAKRLDPHHPWLLTFYEGLAFFAKKRFEESAERFQIVVDGSPDLPWAGLYLAASHGNLGRVEQAKAAVAAYNTARIRYGSLPFRLVELQVPDNQILFKFPERGMLREGLAAAGVPFDFSSDAFSSLKLTSAEIESLLFGHQMRGRSFETGEKYSATISADGSVVAFSGLWGTGSGSVRVDDDQLCFILPSNESCGAVFRNPGGREQVENEYVFFAGGWAQPFSLAD
jgi:TolB-like protein/class 3 adenylate cyclase/Tfp pilus assembly protein PilF